jgi:type VI secretion system protein ImpL
VTVDKSRLTDPRFLVLGAVGLILALGFFLRRHLALFLIVALVIAVAVLGLVLWLMMRELKTAQEAKAGKSIQGGLDKQVEREIEKSVLGQDVVVRNVKAEWDAAMAEFRKSAVGRRLGDRALAQLPMYFVIGPAGSGKSLLIQESGLSSVLRDSKGRPRAVRGVGGGRDFNWWFTEQAFLLDMSGRTLKRSQFDDTEDWVEFLKSLGKQRPERPVNGVVLTVPVHTLGEGDESIEALATTLRERIRDLGHHLRMEIPVWLVFTHCDRIAGFAETFEGYSEEQRKQVWGATIPWDRARRGPSEALFEAEFRALVGALGNLRTARIHALGDDVQRLRALAFPSQLDRLRPALQRFVGKLFPRPSGAAEGGVLRGFYLVASQVGGETVDQVLGAAAESAGLPAQAIAPSPEVARQAWFTPNLWRKIVLRDALLASASEWAKRQQVRRRWFMVGATAGAYLLLTLLFVMLAVRAAEPVRETERVARAVAALDPEEVARRAMVPLDALRGSLDRLEANQRHESFAMRLGAYAGDGVLADARALYVRRTEEHLLQPLAHDLQDTLRLQIATPSTPLASLFYQYQVYRLLEDSHAVVDSQDAVVFGKVLVKMLRPELEHLATDSVRAYVSMARRQAAWLANHGEPKKRFGTFDEALAASAITTLRTRWNDWPTLYDDMIRDANEAIPPLSIRRILSEAKRKQELFHDSDSLSGAYTRQGWETFVRPRLAIMKYVVRNEKDPELNRDMGEKVRDLTATLGKKYADGYVQAWTAFLTGLNGRPIGRQGRESLQREATFDSEILAVMRRTLEETTLLGEPAEVEAVGKRFAPFKDWLVVEKKQDFLARLKGKIPWLKSDSQKSNEDLFQEMLTKTYKAKVNDAYPGVEGPMYTTVVNLVLNAAEPGYVTYDSDVKRAFQHTLLIMGGDTSSQGTSGKSRGGGPSKADTGDPVALRNDWASLSADFASLSGKYPFAGGEDSHIVDFGTFFKPGGTLENVYNAHFKGRMDPDGRIVGKLVSGTSPGMCAWMKKALAIQHAFTWSGADPKLTFDAKAHSYQQAPAGAIEKVWWRVGPASLQYDMGTSDLQTLEWSSETAGQGSSVSAQVSGKDVDGPNIEGEWGLFHVLDKAGLSGAGGGRVLATWHFGGVTMAVEITPRTTVHPFETGFMRLGPPPGAGN